MRALADPLAALEQAALLRQLACPSGAVAASVGEMMARVNAALIERTFDKLDLRIGMRVLEIGPGNGAHFASVLRRAPNLMLAGIDLSQEMVDAARARNADAIALGRVTVKAGSVSAIPFDDAQFDRAIAVNVVYFWPDLVQGLREIRRILRDDAVFALAAMTPATAATMPFEQHGFAIREPDALRTACLEAGFAQADVENYAETMTGGSGTTIAREFAIVWACCA